MSKDPSNAEVRHARVDPNAPAKQRCGAVLQSKFRAKLNLN